MKKVTSILFAIALAFTVSTAKASIDSASIVKAHTDSLVKAYGDQVLPLVEAATGESKIGVFSYDFLLKMIALIAGLVAAGIWKSNKKKHDAAVLAELKSQTEHLSTIAKK